MFVFFLIHVCVGSSCCTRVTKHLKKAFPSLFDAYQGSKLKKMSGRKFATTYENLVATLKMLVVKLIEAI